MDVVAGRWRDQGGTVAAPRAAAAEELARVHHGNGTQHTFEPDPNVLYVSTHQFPFYPGTGAAGEVGTREGAGFTVNLPMEAGAVDQDYRVVYAEVVLPIVRQFKPDLVILS